MGDKPKNADADDRVDPLFLHSVYPDAGAIFSFQPKPLPAVLSDCVVVLDTNVLLVPYNIGKESINQIRTTYLRLASQKRLIVPGRVAREFAQIRSEKLKLVFQQVSRKRDLSITRQTYPLLESVPEYKEVVRLEEQIALQLADYRKALDSLLDAIGSWYWDDPVSAMYRDVFHADVVYDPEVARDEALQDRDRRQVHRIPPGYKDAAKADSGIGDLLIWQTILDVGKQRGADVVFVSGDEKADWWHRSENRALFPRFELVDEFRRASSGKTLHIISFSELLRTLGASSNVIQEVQKEEVLASAELRVDTTIIKVPAYSSLPTRVMQWLAERYPGGAIGKSEGNNTDYIVHDPAAGKVAFKAWYLEDLNDENRFVARLETTQAVLLRDMEDRGISKGYILLIASSRLHLYRTYEIVLGRKPLVGLIALQWKREGLFQRFRVESSGEGSMSFVFED